MGEASRFRRTLEKCRESRRLVLVVVAVALLVDRMLLTAVVPVIPALLASFREQPNGTTQLQKNATLEDDVTQPMNLTLEDAKGGETDGIHGSNSSLTEDVPRCHWNQSESGEGRENMEVGFLFSSKAIVQLIMNPFVGPLTHKNILSNQKENSNGIQEEMLVGEHAVKRLILLEFLILHHYATIGYSLPMFAGFTIIFFSTIAFAFGRSYWMLLLARILQGVGSSCSTVSGMGMLAERYPDERERGIAMGIALGGLAFGCVVGPTFGGVMYEFVGKSSPFIVLAGLALADASRSGSFLSAWGNRWGISKSLFLFVVAVLQLVALQPKVKEKMAGPSLVRLLMDPYICIAAGVLLFANMSIAILEPSYPLWMERTMCASVWQQGVVWLSPSISYLLGTCISPTLAHKIGRWVVTLVGLILLGTSLALVPQSTRAVHLIAPLSGLGFSVGMVDTCMMPELARLVDIRHFAVYGTVYAIADVAFCLGFAVGPALAMELVTHVGFDWMLYIMATICFAYSPLLCLLRNPPAREGAKVGFQLL
ncbi:unnamed protein product, partial [Darwinula stevensoni]